ncbi:MAG: acyl-CoA synthetase [Peptococcaceae bacterium BICA1-7]|nr:MAG: acyl-CoA synthetase [Peptococcaceae bacterium BICA1-7]HBV99500.1 acyl-CoA synthetase [Desulfotomaculum sp.]
MGVLNSFFSPGSVAVIGASKTPGKIGNAIVKNMVGSGYKGDIYPVNPREKEIEGLKCYPDIASIEKKVDLAVISVPAAGAVKVAEQCGRAGVKSLVVVSAGFKEVGKEGLALEKEMLRICRDYGMRLLGPNCVGMMDTHVPINASFSEGSPAAGNIAFISQSGAMLVAILDWSKSSGIGFSKIISLGNKADLTETDFIGDAAEDPNTRVILCYIEDIADGKHFLKTAREASAKKPVIILKSGTSQAGAQAASSHTGALAGSNLAYDTAFRQSGIIRASTMAELFDLAVAFSSQPVPGGSRVAVVTNAGGPGIVTTDSIEETGLTMARFSKNTIEALRSGLPEESNIYNPVDVLGDAKTDRFSLSMNSVLADENVDSLVVLICPTAVTEAEETARSIVEAHRSRPDKPVFAALMGGESLAGGSEVLSAAGVPSYTFPETAVSVISGMTRYSRLRQTQEAPAAEKISGIDPRLVKESFAKVKDEGRLVLLGSESYQVAEAYGIPAAPVRLAVSPDEAALIAGEMGYPLVLKVASPKILHKTDVGGVKIGINNADEVRRGFVEITENVHRHFPRTAIHGIEIQKMMPKGTELIIGMSRDVQFGPLIAFGLGGIYVNLLKDVAFRLAQGLTRQEALAMISETKASTLLRGYRGEEPADIEAVIDIILRTAALVTDFPDIAEMDINPVFAYTKGASALDIKITIS